MHAAVCNLLGRRVEQVAYVLHARFVSRLWLEIYFGVSCLLIRVGGKQIALGDGGSALGAIKSLTHISTTNGTTRAIQQAPLWTGGINPIYEFIAEHAKASDWPTPVCHSGADVNTITYISRPSLCPTFLLSPMVWRVGSDEFCFGMQIDLNMTGATLQRHLLK